MSLVVLLILAVVWAVFLIPQVVRARAEKTPADSIGAFRSQLSVLEKATPAPWGTSRSKPPYLNPAVVAPYRASVAERRRNVVLALLGAMGVTLLLGMLPPLRFVLAAHLLVDALFVAYIALLARARTIGVEREMKVRYLPERGTLTGAPAFMLRQSAGS